jgi:Kef-type K+ transport system membrane component KefB
MEIENLLLIMVVVWLVGVLFRHLKLPILLGELLAGLIFGPALFGVFESNETISVLAELGIFFLMLHAGLETAPKDLIHSSKTSLGMAFGGTLLPIVFGTLIGLYFGYTGIQSVFIGLALSTTAISVTTKIFRDFRFNKSKVAHMVMGAAILSDITAFLILSIIIGVVEGGGSIEMTEVLILMAKVGIFFGGTIFAGTKLLPWFEKIFTSKGQKAFTFTLIIALAFGAFAEFIGLHYILGAYLAGLFVKEEIVHPEVFKKIEDRLFGLSYSFLGPIFFVSLGFHVDFGVLQEPDTLLFLIMIIVAAIVGKIIGAGGMAYLTGRKKSESLLIGISMNGRGAVELIIALIGLEMGLIDERVFSILVFMAFCVTLITPITLKAYMKAMGRKQSLDTEYEGN